jgi:hypothetical protein
VMIPQVRIGIPQAGRSGAGGAAPAWSPLSFGSALRGWYDAQSQAYSDAGVTPAVDGGPVTQLSDRSPLAAHATALNAGLKPIFRATGLNGRPGIETGPALAAGMATGRSSVIMGGDFLTVFTAIQVHQDSAANGRILSFEATDDILDYQTATSGIPLMSSGGNGLVAGYRGDLKAQVNVTYDAPIRLIGSFDSAFHSLRLNNLAVGTPVASPGTFGADGMLLIGSVDSGNAIAKMILGEMFVVAGRVPTEDEYAAADAYLANRWGL